MIWLIGVPSADADACFAIERRSLSAAVRSRPLSYFSPPKTLTILCAPMASSSACVSVPVRSCTIVLTRFMRRLILRSETASSGIVASAISVSCQLR